MAAPKMFQAVDNFVAEMADGSALHVAKGAVFHGSHELVKRDSGRGLLFRALDDGADATVASAAPKDAGPAPADGEA